MNVVVAGAGLGGLCLAHGLRKAGIPVTVYERDAASDARAQGYRVHIDDRGANALRECLNPDLYELFVATSGQPSTRLSFVDRNLHEKHAVEGRGTGFSAGVDRMLLRQILLAGLGGAVKFGFECTGYDASESRVVVQFKDRPPVDGDVVVGADGVGSVVAARRLPQLRVKDLGKRCIYGRTQIGGFDLKGFMGVHAGRVGLGLGIVRPREDPGAAARRIRPGMRLDWPGDYLMWSLVVPKRQVRNGLDDPAALHAFAVKKVAGWHPDVVAAIAEADVSATRCVSLAETKPAKPWEASPVTLIGDAVHAMSPATGSGANLALQDAAMLAEELAKGAHPIQAVAAYEKRMRNR